MVTRDELRQKVWPSSVYIDFNHGFANAIVPLRNAFGDTAGNARFIKTLPRLGYRFICPVEKVPVAAQTTVQQIAAGIDMRPIGPIPPAVPPRNCLGAGCLSLPQSWARSWS
jgi:DNA-binding winged helix-turn-helix (wHTH) protein